MKKFYSKIFSMLLALVVIIFGACQKNINEFIDTNNNNPTQGSDLTTKVRSSVSGFVTNENDMPVIGASVKVGSITTVTDEYGFFIIRNANVVKNAAVVTVTKSGYFKGIKTYQGVEGKSVFFRIKLIPKNTVGVINSTSGGNVTLSNGMIVSLPANAVVVASSSAPYSGNINVSAYWIDPTSLDLDRVMPGDLRGIDKNNTLKVLTTFGMVAVELSGDNGSLLQIAEGKKATLTFPLPAAANSVAPASIALWSFDEDSGLWVEEGTANKVGNTYVGEVSHFSFWNCDQPDEYVYFDCNILDAAGQPLPYVWVKLTVLSNPWNSRYGHTDSSGYVGGIVPANETLKLEVFTNYSCNTSVFTQEFSTTSSNLSLGNLLIPNTTLNQALVAGTVNDCNNSPVTNGYLIMLSGNVPYRYELNSSGSYSYTKILCSGTETVTLIGEDVNSGQQSTPLTYVLNNGANNVPLIQACGVTTEQFFNYSIDGTQYNYSSPADSFYMYVNPQATPAQITISGSRINSGTSTSGYFSFDQPGIAVGAAQNMTSIYLSQIPDISTINNTILVNITEYGAVGEFIAGNFSGSMTGPSPTFTVYNIIGSFRVRRSQ
jgi:hypothetical protein